MSNYYRQDNQHKPAPRVHSPKRNPFQTTAHPRKCHEVPGNPECRTDLNYSPSKLRVQPNHNQVPNHDSDKSLLEMLSSTVACLRQKNMDLEALGCLEQSLWLKRRMFGVDNSVVHKALNEVMLSYNSVAMQYLSQGQFDQCLAMLRKAEAITAPGNFKRCQALQILTFNNIGCCYRKLGKLKSALKYLKEAAQIGSGSAHVKNLSITHLNLCAIQSQLGRHDLALEHAQAAIFHTQEELVYLEDGGSDERDEDGERDNDNRDQASLVDALDPKTREEKIISLAVAYHNLAVELEFNGRGEASLQWYKKALQLVWKYRETNEALCESFKKIFLDAKKKQQTANVRQNGIPAASCTSKNPTNGRRPISRPRSAHVSFRSGNEVDRGDVSYSSTVASQCYKATKPSTAGLRYGSPRSMAAARGGKPQRPASATTRQRPVSAKPSTRASYRNNHGLSDSADDAFETHWKKLEKEHALNDFQSAASKNERRIRRPQSAGSARGAARRRNQVSIETQKRQKLQGQLYFAAKDEDIIGNDEDYGIVLDDGDCDGDFDNFPKTVSSPFVSNHTDGAAATYHNPRGSYTKTNRSTPTLGPRHRRVLDDSRSQTFVNESEPQEGSDAGAFSIQSPEQSLSSASLAGYSGDDDTDPDLPAQRVCHMEYLRRMKKLAESIKDDLNGIGVRPPAVKLAELTARHPDSPAYRKESGDLANGEGGSRVSTPRSATSKLRDRIEQARRDSWDALHEGNTSGSRCDQVQSVLSARNQSVDNGVDLREDVHVFESEAKARDAELQLFREAAGCRLQAFFRGQCCRAEVRQLKQVKRENDSASMIQRQVRQYLKMLKEERRLEDERFQLELQKEEVEDMAACLIQRLCRRVLSRKIACKVENASEDESEEEEEAPPRRPFSVADVVLGASVNKSVGSTRTLPNQVKPADPPHLNPAATVPRMNLAHQQEPEATRRSSSVASILLHESNTLEEFAQPSRTRRSDVYDDDEEWQLQPPRSTISSPRTSRSQEEPKSLSIHLADTTPGTSRSMPEKVNTQLENIAATHIQACIKGFIIRRHIARGHAGDISRTYIERKHFNIAYDHALNLEQEFVEELSVIKIQALVRGRQSRLLTECMKAGIHTAASTIQRSFRLHRQSTQRAVNEGVRSIAARAIQQVYREYEARRAALHEAAVDEELRNVQQIAATTIQNFWKQYFSEREHCLEKIEAATCIQALGRGHITRKSLKSLNGSSSGSGLSKHSSAFSMSSEKLVEEDAPGSARSENLYGVNYSFLPTSIRELYIMSTRNETPNANNQIRADEIVELGLTFGDFLRELETCTDTAVGCSALDAIRMVVEMSPESTKTLANVVKVAQTLDRRLQEGFWNQDIEVSSIALLWAFRDVLDAQ
ncbi:unnamed protein product [Phytophthora lilii]|uniref:Unnamed protein product n=1 Tax=Phytophthora lilii TaxID=2077276 RepID=A0A9W6YK77_9STRA|nr:unnamed protein product [Phytophthora lilii]